MRARVSCDVRACVCVCVCVCVCSFVCLDFRIKDLVGYDGQCSGMRHSLEDIFRLMLMIWCRERLALRALSPRGSGTFRLQKTNKNNRFVPLSQT